MRTNSKPKPYECDSQLESYGGRQELVQLYYPLKMNKNIHWFNNNRMRVESDLASIGTSLK